MELTQNFPLVDHMMESLMAKDHVHGLIGQRQRRARDSSELNPEPMQLSLGLRAKEHLRVAIECDDSCRPEAIVEQRERASEATSKVEDDRIRYAVARKQPLEIIERGFEHIFDPDVRT